MAKLQIAKNLTIESEKLFLGHIAIVGKSVDYSQPIMYEEDGNTRIEEIGAFVDRHYDMNQVSQEAPVPVRGIRVPCLNHSTLKIEWHPMQYVLRHRSSGQLLRFHLQTGRTITVTPEHSLFTLQDGAVVTLPATELDVGKIVLAPSRIPPSNMAFQHGVQRIDVIEILKKSSDDELRTFYLHDVPEDVYQKIPFQTWTKGKKDLFYRWRQQRKLPFSYSEILSERDRQNVTVSARRGIAVPARLPVDVAFARFLGYYLAEGSARRTGETPKTGYQVYFTLGPRDDIIIHAITAFLNKRFCKSGVTIRPHGEKGRRLIINDKVLFQVVSTLVGTGAHRKRVPSIILSSPTKVRTAFIDAWLSGDAGTTVNLGIASDVHFLFLLEGIVSTFYKQTQTNLHLPGGRFQEVVECYHLRFPIGRTGTTMYLRGRDEPKFVPVKAVPNPLRDIFRREFAGSRTRVTPAAMAHLTRWSQELRPRLRLSKDACAGNGQYRTAFRKRLLVMQGRKSVLSKIGAKVVSEIELLDRLMQSDLAFLEVKRREWVPATSEYVYDVSVPEHENFICGFGGVICHNTGAGKSRNVAAKLLGEFLEKQPAAPDGSPWAFLVIDANDEYAAGFLDAYPGKVVVFSPDATKGVPFRISTRNITAEALKKFLTRITRKQLSKDEESKLYFAIEDLKTKNGNYSLEQIYARLYELEAGSLLSALDVMVATGIFGPEETPNGLLVRPGQLSIVTIGGYSRDVQAVIIAHLLGRLWAGRKNGETGATCVLLEEASSFCPEGKLTAASDDITLISTQARGYYFILISVFQRSSLTSKTVLSQSSTWFIGKTTNTIDRKAIVNNAEDVESEHDQIIKELKMAEEFLIAGPVISRPVIVKIPDQGILVQKGGRIKAKTIEATFKREDMADYIAKIQHLEEDERHRLQDTLSRVREEREAKAKAPIIPKEAEREIGRLKRDLEQLQTRYQKALDGLKEREKAADRKARERYEAKVKELEADKERLTRQLAIAQAGGEQEGPVWEQDIVKQRLRPLSEKQHDLVIFLERVGPSAPEKIAPTLGVSRKTVTSYVSDINRRVQGLIVFDERQGTYRSRLAELFPVKKAEETDDVKQLRFRNEELASELQSSQDKIRTLEGEKNELLEKSKRLPVEESKETIEVLSDVERKLAKLVQSVASKEEEA